VHSLSHQHYRPAVKVATATTCHRRLFRSASCDAVLSDYPGPARRASDKGSAAFHATTLATRCASNMSDESSPEPPWGSPPNLTLAACTRRSFAPNPAHHARPLLTSALATSLTCQIRFLVPNPIRSAPTGSCEHVARPTWPPPSPPWQHATPTVPPPSAQGAPGRLWERPAVGGGKTLVWGSGSGPSGGRAPVRQ
jgi:hypothetical protein